MFLLHLLHKDMQKIIKNYLTTPFDNVIKEFKETIKYAQTEHYSRIIYKNRWPQDTKYSLHKRHLIMFINKRKFTDRVVKY